MTRPRATSSAVDELGAVIADLKARLVRVEQQSHLHNVSASQLLPIGGIIDWPSSGTVPSGFALMGTTVTNAQTLYPTLWSVSPAGWKSGANLVLPTLSGRTAIIRLI